MYYFCLNHIIISTSEKALRDIVEKLQNLCINNIDDEDVQKAVSYICAAVNILDSYSCSPNDLQIFMFRTSHNFFTE